MPLLLALALLAITFALRLPTFGRSVVNWDESLYLLIADGWLHGKLPYLAIWDHKPVGLYLVYELALLAFGRTAGAPRILATLFVFAAALLLYRVVRAVTDDHRSAMAAALLYPAFTLTLDGLAGNSEHFFIALNLAGAALLVRAYECGDAARKLCWLALAGLTFGVALQLKYIAVFEAAFFVACYLVAERTRPGRLAPLYHAKGLALLGLGAGLPTLMAYLYFRAHGAGDLFLETNFLANLRHTHLSQFVSNAYARWLRATAVWYHTIRPLAAVVVVGWAFRLVVRRPWRLRHEVVLVLWLAVGLVEAAATRRFYPHYYLVTIAPLCALAGLAISHVVGSFRWLTGGRGLVATVCMALVLASFPAWKTAGGVYRGWREEPVDEPARVAAILRPHLREGDLLHVVDDQPVLYFLTGASPATRYVFPPHLVFGHFAPVTGVDHRAEFERILRKRPRCIVARKETRSRRARAFLNMLGPEYKPSGETEHSRVWCR